MNRREFITLSAARRPGWRLVMEDIHAAPPY
jgi:hypothetical protein